VQLDDRQRADIQLDVHPDRHLTYLIAKVSHQLQLVLDRALQAEGLTLTQFSALAHIGRAPGLSSADLARALLTTPQAVATLVRRLIALGLVERPEIGRGLAGTIRLTQTGLHKLQAAEELALPAEQHALNAITPAQKQHVAAILKSLLESLEQPPQSNGF
jgi:DNA-binding MarR family transcriptional regulator